MILTLTPNPTIDRAVFCRGFRLGGVVRAEREQVTPSGKGVDASLVLHELGGATRVLGLQAGLNGRMHGELLDRWGIAHDMLPAAGETRMATVLVDLAVNQQSTITAPTLIAGEEQLTGLLHQLQGYAGQAWGLICGGSLPPGLPVDSYACLIRRARALGLVTLLDTSGDALRHGVGGVPHVLKVNDDELWALLASARGAREPRPCQVGAGPQPSRSATGQGRADLEALAGQLGAYLGEWASEALVITLGAGGALAVTEGGVFWARPPVVRSVNTAGAGDALAAGVMLARSRGADWPEALRLGTAAAASVVMNEGTAICQREQVEELRPKVQIDSLTAGGIT
jgi:1-phosphofructokinase family hexose kinase